MKISFIYKFFVIFASFLIIFPLITKAQTNIENQFIKSSFNPQQIQEIFNKNTKNTETVFGIVVWDLNKGQKIYLNENEQFESASLYKLAVMYTLFYLESHGKLDTEKKDIKDSLESMITVSSNEASLYLVEQYTSWTEITELMKEKGLSNTSFDDSTLLTTPKDIAKLLSLINNPQDINPRASKKMMDLLGNQTINDRIPALLPDETSVYHKTGDIDELVHDAGIVIGPNGTKYILVIMTKNSDMPEKIKPVIAKISEEIYDLLQNK